MCPVCTAHALEVILVKPTYDDQLSDQTDLFHMLHVKQLL